MSAFNDWCTPGPNLECRPYGSNVSDVDPDRLITPFEGVNYTGCDEDMQLSDFDGDGRISNVEYASFVQKTAARRCNWWPELNLGQKTNFISLACQCAKKEGESPACCVGPNAHLAVAGADSPTSRTEPQAVFLQNVCVVTYGTLPTTNCSLKVLPVLDPPPIIIDPLDTRTGAVSAGTRWTLVAAMIGGLLLLLLLCCCCCVMRQKKRKEYEEEEIVETEYPGKEEWLEQPLQEQAPRSMPAEPMDHEPVALAAVPPVVPPVDDEESEYSGEGDNRGGGHDDDEESDGSGRRRRGGNYVGEDDENTRRRWPGGTIPDEEKDREQIQLKPIPPKDPKPDDPWDEPGRNIDEIKPDPDEMSAQEFERYDPGGGVYDPKRPQKDPVEWNNKWEKGRPPEGDEYDDRKHRIQAGMGEGEIWDKLDQDDQSKSTMGGTGGDAFDWVVQSAMNVMDTADEHGHLSGDEDSTVVSSQK